MADEKVKPRRGRPKTMTDEARREAIVAVAEALFAAKGFVGTSTDEIAARCKISKQTLYRIFPCKTDLFGAVVDVHRMRMIDLGDGYDDLPLGQALAKIFMIDLDQRAYELRAAFLRAAHVESFSEPQLREILRCRGGYKARADLKSWLDRQCVNGRLVIKDTDRAAHMLMDTFAGSMVFDALGGFGWASREERIAHFKQCIDIFLKGALPDQY
ncbi:TetR/AcrR family transcriptional regulator [Pseudodesulfovibrio indicus]|uniref:TetR/AcrR family transcriptional regulator n=1 Tax=Pseudodesulfovibrio indicus TaxID=1716143 RepID=UPI00292F02AE|nr:TetR/AcrR family transcriptional regulator [Pseudodesulfovibrio indicus]